MFDQPPEKQSIQKQSIQKQFQDLDDLLRALMENLSSKDGRTLLPVNRSLQRVSESLKDLNRKVGEHFQARQHQLEALMGTGHVINTSLGLNRVLEEVMDSLIALMRAERGFLMLREADGELSVRLARGIDRVKLDEEAFAVSGTIVREVAESGKPILTTNARQDPRFEKQMSVAAYQLRSILCAPLKIKNQLIGVIYVDNRAHTGIFQPDDLGLISAFADQAAVAIDNARLFENLQASHAELQIAYQATLEGWIRALDLRDRETEGHTQRVTVLTRRLAQAMSVDEQALIHITRGALLHDIGKMAIPDGILLKPGELTSEERALVQRHPVFAFEMLSPIQFLVPALDIPYCHHEKWDGSGYPRGLKGEEIPFAARIFSVVDVWDALVSDRPYRQGVDPEEVRRHIRAGAGSHFDPHAAEAFLSLGDLAGIGDGRS